MPAQVGFLSTYPNGSMIIGNFTVLLRRPILEKIRVPVHPQRLICVNDNHETRVGIGSSM